MTQVAAAPRVRRTSSWSLRRRLLVSVVAVFVVLTSAIACASVLSMRIVLLDKVDQQARQALVDMTTQPDGRLDLNGPQSAPPGTVWLIVDEDGDVLHSDVVGDAGYLSDANAEVLVASAQSTTDEGPPPVTTANLRGSFGDMRVVAVPVLAEGSSTVADAVLIIAVPTSEANQLVGALAFVIGISVIIAALALIALGDALIRRSLRPLTSVIATTERISQLPLDSGDVQLSNRVRITDSATEVGRVSESVNRMLDHVETSLEARAQSERKVRQFVADASHELRTPLAAVQGYAEITRKHEAGLSEEGRMSLTRIEAAADRMSSLVNDLLLLARLDEGREIDRDVVDLSLLVIDAVADAQAAGPEHPVALELPEEPVEVIGDLLRLQQIVANLLANARIHTPAGTHVEARLSVGEGDDDGFAVVEIADDGPGVPPALRAKVFERFVRGDASRSRVAGSSGLGLAIVRALVEAHGGSIALRSEPGETVFTVRVPLAHSTLEPSIAPSSAAPLSAASSSTPSSPAPSSATSSPATPSVAPSATPSGARSPRGRKLRRPTTR